MPEAPLALLRRALLDAYAELKARLARRLGSIDLASEALHETWLRLQQAPEIAPVANPKAYLYRAALNTATNLRIAQARRLTATEVDALFDLADEAPGPDRAAAARQEMALLLKALAELTPRQQDVFRETFGQGVPQAELARRHRVGLRTIQSDLHVAIRHCARRLGRKSFFASKLSGLSRE